MPGMTSFILPQGSLAPGAARSQGPDGICHDCVSKTGAFHTITHAAVGAGSHGKTSPRPAARTPRRPGRADEEERS